MPIVPNDLTNPASILGEIFINNLNLTDDQIFIKQGFKLPQDDRMYINIVELSDKVIANEKKHIKTLNETGALINISEVITIQKIGLFSIHLYSNANPKLYDPLQDVNLRKQELATSLVSQYASQVIDKYRIRIPKAIMNFTNTSETAGSSVVNLIKWTATIEIGYSYSTQPKSIEYYDAIDTNGTIEY